MLLNTFHRVTLANFVDCAESQNYAAQARLLFTLLALWVHAVFCAGGGRRVEVDLTSKWACRLAVAKEFAAGVGDAFATMLDRSPALMPPAHRDAA